MMRMENSVTRSRFKIAMSGTKKNLSNIPAHFNSLKYCRLQPERGSIDPIVKSSYGRKATLVTVAFNRSDLIELQGSTLNQHFKEPFIYVVADNSDEPHMRHEIEACALALGALYIALPPQPPVSPSMSHGLALNWVANNILKHCKSEYFGLLDHDIFLLRDASYSAILSAQGTYGHFQSAGRYRYYWPGLMFFKPGALDPSKAKFQPRWFGNTYADTGAANWGKYYSKWQLSSLSVMRITDVQASSPNDFFAKTGDFAEFAADALTIFDDRWVHLINGSNWAKIDAPEKLELTRQFIEHVESI